MGMEVKSNTTYVDTTQVDTNPETGEVTQTGSVTEVTTETPVDGVDSGAVVPTSGGPVPVPVPSVDGPVTVDNNLASATAQDIGTIAGVLSDAVQGGKMSAADMDAILAKLMVAFGINDRENSEELNKMAKERAEAQAAEAANKAADMAQLMSIANDGGCHAQQRLENKLEEMGYPPDQAAKLADDIAGAGRGKGHDHGMQALMAMEAVENAPKYQATGEGLTDAEAGVLNDTQSRFAADGMSPEDQAAMMMLFMIMIGANKAALTEEGSSPGSTGGQPGGQGGGGDAGTGGPTTGGTGPVIQ